MVAMIFGNEEGFWDIQMTACSVTETANIVWPPPYTIKKHPRAKSVKLRALLRSGLEITVPSRFNLKTLPEILETHKNWIIEQLHKLQEKRQVALPQEIFFAALQEGWSINYEHSAQSLRLIERPAHQLVVLGEAKQKTQFRGVLLHWVKTKARTYLFNELCKVSRETGLSFRRFSLRNQRTRWGSCSHDKGISLNYKLIFLEPHLVRYILIHELAHTIHFNHSPRFWSLVAQYDPAWQAHRVATRRAEEMLPAWLE